MNCPHCGALRTVDAGVSIGGRFALTMVPGCPCSSLRKIIEGESVTLNNLIASVEGDEFAHYEEVLRFCTAVSGKVRPRITNVTCNNYDMSAMTVSSLITVRNGVELGCTYNDTFPELGEATWSNFEDPSYTCFVASGIVTQFYACVLEISSDKSPGFVDPPSFNLDYVFDRIGCP